MAITLIDFLTFPFNGGKGIRANQIADVDVPEMRENVDHLQIGRLPYRWYASVRDDSDFERDFSEDDFKHLIAGSYSDFGQLDFPVFTADDYYTAFGAFAVPYDAPEPAVISPFNRPIYTDDPRNIVFWPLLEPLYIDGEPYRVYRSRQHLRQSTYSGREYTIQPQVRLTGYTRYARATTSAAVPDFTTGDSATSTTSVIRLPDFGGANRYLHFALPFGTAILPTYVGVATDGAANIASQFAVDPLGQLQVLDGKNYIVYSSSSPLAAGTYSGQRVIIFPERDGVTYARPPSSLADTGDVGYTWYAGFYVWAGFRQPVNPITDDFLTQSGFGISESTTAQVTMPDDGGSDPKWDPHLDYLRASRFIIQPATEDPIVAVLSLRHPTYPNDAATFRTSGTYQFDTFWSLQPNSIDVGGVEHDVYLHRKTLSIYTQADARSNAETMAVWREAI